MSTDSFFADPERSDDKTIRREEELLKAEKTILDVLGAVSGISAVINGNRQIVYANDAFLGLLGIRGIELIVGKRPGEAIGCKHAGEMNGGCGTSQACQYCGAINSIVESQLNNRKSVRETRLTTVSEGQEVSWDLRVTTSPVVLHGKIFYIFSVEDISSEKRKQNLEKIFFHDILNSAGNLNAFLLLLKETNNPVEEKELLDLSADSSRDLIEEILTHRDMISAEIGDLRVTLQEINLYELLNLQVEKILKNDVAAGKNIRVSSEAGIESIKSDRLILQRVIANMLKNALEASGENEEVETCIENHGDRIRISVKNKAVMTDEVVHQVFQRSFSTKGTGRGFGTYSIKLLTENYLNGKAGFSSAPGKGTEFWIDLPANGIRI
ncbi:MAG TPA: PAS domain-containing sensor histidine kinase [Bacteroidales bacterium]|nr:PAS domain-containing sensor histidine kinase [Bacteroidales bacterium]